MAMRLANGTALVKADAVNTRVNTGAGTAKCEIYTGGQPTQADDAPTGTKLLSFDLPNPCFNNAIDANPGAQLAIDAADLPIAAVGLAAGVAGWGRVINRNGDTVFDGLVGAEITLDNTNITIGQNANLTGLTYTQPES